MTHLTSVHPRYDTRIFHKHAVFAAASGYSVSMLVNDQHPNEMMNNVSIISTNWVFQSKFKRILYSVFLFPFKSLKIKSNLYIIHDPELIPCGLILKLLGKKVIYDIHEDYHLIHSQKNTFLSSVLGIFYKLVSNFFVRQIDGVFVVNDRLESQYGSIARHLVLVPNFPIIDKVKPISKSLDDGNLKIIFAGGITEDWNVSLISNILSELEDVEFHIAGKSNHYLDSILDNHYANLIYHGHLMHDEVLDLMVQMDMGMAISSSIQLQGEGSIGNTKVFEYLAAGLAVIVNDNKVWREIIKDNNVGFVLDGIEDISHVINSIKHNKDALKEMKLKAQKIIAEKYNWDKTFLNVVNMYEDIAHG